MKQISVMGIDIAKSSFQLHGNDERGKGVEKKTLRRQQLEAYVANLPPCTIAMEACASAHYWACRFGGHGHQVRLIAPQYVKPFVKGNKNDRADAEAIAEAASRPSMRFVPLKTVEQLDLQTIHRVRARLIGQRTALANEMRAILFEQGIALPQGIAGLKTFVKALNRGETKQRVTPVCAETMTQLMEELEDLQGRVEATENRLERMTKENPVCRRLQTIPGIGLITATAILAAVPDARTFKNGRQFAAWLGLVPRHSGTGGADKNKLGHITKRGDKYLRCLLVHGARAVIRTSERRTDRSAAWVKGLKEKKGWNKAAVALANKNARVVWALLTTGESWDVTKMAA
jgi:transposase